MSGGKSKSETNSSQGVWGTQSPYLSDLYSQAQGALPGAQAQAGQIGQQGINAWGNMLNPQGNPYLQAMNQQGLNQIGETYQNQILPGINNAAMGAGSLGSSRQGIAQGLAAQGATREMGNFTTNLYGQQYQQDQNRAMGALAMLPQMQNSPWAALQGYQQMIGGPTVLGSSSGRSKSLQGGVS